MEKFFGYNEINKSQYDLEKFNQEINDHFNNMDFATGISKGKQLLQNNTRKKAPKLHKTNNIYDSFSEEEEVKTSEFLLAPFAYSSTNRWLCIYKVILYLMILSHISIAYYWMSFNPITDDLISSKENKYIIIMDILVLVQYIISSIVVYDAEDNVIIKLKAITMIFERDGVLIDILVSIPFFFINYRLSNYAPGHQNILFQSFLQSVICHGRWLKIFTLLRFNSYANKLTRIINVRHLDLLVSAINYILYFHFTACLWIYTSSLVQVSFSAGWIQYYFANSDESTIYIASLYFNFVTLFTVGYGDIVPHHVYEYFFLIFLLIISATIYAVLFSTISSIFTSTEMKSQMLDKRREILDQIDMTSKVPDIIRCKIMNFYKYSLNMNMENKSNLLESIPPKMKNELLNEMYGSTVKNLKFLNGCKEEFNFYILGLLKPFSLEKGEILLGLGSYYTDVYFVVRGQLDFFIPLNTKHARFYSLHRGENFGEINILANEAIDYKISSSKKKSTELLLLSKEKLLDLKANFPALFKEKIRGSLRIYQIMDNNKLLYLEKFTKEVKENTSYKKMITQRESVIDSPQVNMNFPSPYAKFMKGCQKGASNFTELKLQECCNLEKEQTLSFEKGELSINKILLGLSELALKIDKTSDTINKTSKFRKDIHQFKPRTIILERIYDRSRNKFQISKVSFEEEEDKSRSNISVSNGVTIKVIKLYLEDNCESLPKLKIKLRESRSEDDNKSETVRQINKKRSTNYESDLPEKLVHNRINDQAKKKAICPVLKKSKYCLNSTLKSRELISECTDTHRNKISMECNNNTLYNSRIDVDLSADQQNSIVSKIKAEPDKTQIKLQINLTGLKNTKSFGIIESPLHIFKNPTLKKRDSVSHSFNLESDRSRYNELTLCKSKKLMSIIKNQTKTEFDEAEFIKIAKNPLIPESNSFRLNKLDEQFQDLEDIEISLKRKIKERQSKKDKDLV